MAQSPRNAIMKGVKKVRNTMVRGSSLRRMETGDSTSSGMEDEEGKKTSNHSHPSLLDELYNNINTDDDDDKDQEQEENSQTGCSIDTSEVTTTTTRLERIMAQARGLKSRAEQEAKKRQQQQQSKDSNNNKKNKKKKRSLIARQRRESATIYAALDMVTPKNVRCQLAEIRQEKTIIKLDIEDLIISGIETGQSEELLVDISSFLFEQNGRKWETINFIDNVGPNDLKTWLRSKRETMDFFEDLFREQPGILGFETLTFQGKMEAEEGSHLGNLFNLFRNIKRQRRVTNVKIFVDHSDNEVINERAVDELFHLNSSLVGGDGELLDPVIVLVTFGWLPDPDGLSIVDSCLRVAKTMGAYMNSTIDAAAPNTPAGAPLRRVSTDPSLLVQRAATSAGPGLKRSGTHQLGSADENNNMGLAARRESRRSTRLQRTSLVPGLRGPTNDNNNNNNNPIRPARRSNKTTQRTRRNSSRANIISVQRTMTPDSSTKQSSRGSHLKAKPPTMGLGGRATSGGGGNSNNNNNKARNGGGGLARARRASSAPNLNALAALNPRNGGTMSNKVQRQRSAESQYSSDGCGIDSSVHSSELSDNSDSSNNDDDESFGKDSKKSHIDLLDDSNAQQHQQVEANAPVFRRKLDLSAYEDDDGVEVRPTLKKSLSEARGLVMRGLESEIRREPTEQRKSKNAEWKASSRSAHARSSVKLEHPALVAPIPRRAGMERSRSASNLMKLRGAPGANQNPRERISRSSHQRRSILGLEDTALALPNRPSQRALARSASASNLLNAVGDQEVGKSAKANAMVSKSRRAGRRSIRELALPNTAAPTVRRTSSGSNLFGKLEWAKGGGGGGGGAKAINEGVKIPAPLPKQAEEEEETTKTLTLQKSLSVSDLTNGTGSMETRSDAQNNKEEPVVSSEKNKIVEKAEGEDSPMKKGVSSGKNEEEPSSQESKEPTTKETQAEDENKNSVGNPVKRNSGGNSKQKTTRTGSRTQKTVKVTKIADLPNPEVKKRQSQHKRRTAGAKGSRISEKAASSGKARRGQEQEDKVATKATAPEKRRVRRSQSDRRPSLDSSSTRSERKRKSIMRKLSKDTQRAIAAREKWSAELPVGGVEEDAGTDPTDLVASVDPLVPPASRLQNLEKSLSESILGLMDDSSSDEEEEVDADIVVKAKRGEKLEADPKRANKGNSVEEEKQKQAESQDSAHGVYEEEAPVNTKTEESEDKKEATEASEKEQGGAKSMEEQKSAVEENQEQIASSDTCPEELEKDVSANNQESGDKEEDQSVGSAANSADSASQASESPTGVSEGLAEAPSTPTESEESVRVKSLLSSAKRKKIDGILAKVKVGDQSSAPCAAY